MGQISVIYAWCVSSGYVCEERMRVGLVLTVGQIHGRNDPNEENINVF